MLDNNTKKRIFDLYASIPGFIRMRPEIVSIGPVPLSTDNRVSFSSPDLIEVIADALIKEIDWGNIDLIVGAETAGIPLAFLLSLKTRIPFCYVRKQKRGKGADSFISGKYKKGDRAILIDDIMAKGDTKKLFMENLKIEGVETAALAMILTLDADLYKSNPARQEIENRGVPIYQLFTWEELVREMHKRGKIPNEIFPHFIDFVQHPETWQKNIKKWNEYFKVLNKLNIQVPEEVKKAVDDLKS